RKQRGVRLSPSLRLYRNRNQVNSFLQLQHISAYRLCVHSWHLQKEYGVNRASHSKNDPYFLHGNLSRLASKKTIWFIKTTPPCPGGAKTREDKEEAPKWRNKGSKRCR